jgi:hypothetical protein
METLHILDADAAHPKRVFAVSSAEAESAGLDDGGGGGSSHDPLHQYRNMLVAGAILTEWTLPSGHAHKRHVVVTPEFSGLVVRDPHSSGRVLFSSRRPPQTVFFRDLRTCFAGSEALIEQLRDRPVFTLHARGVASVFECASLEDRDAWVAALHAILHLVRQHDTKWLNLLHS